MNHSCVNTWDWENTWDRENHRITRETIRNLCVSVSSPLSTYLNSYSKRNFSFWILLKFYNVNVPFLPWLLSLMNTRFINWKKAIKWKHFLYLVLPREDQQAFKLNSFLGASLLVRCPQKTNSPFTPCSLCFYVLLSGFFTNRSRRKYSFHLEAGETSCYLHAKLFIC